MLWETMGLMLAGRALFRAHMLTGEWAAGRYRKWAIVSFTVTIPPLAALAAWQIGAGFDAVTVFGATAVLRSEEHTSELQSLMRISYAVFCLKKKKIIKDNNAIKM